MPSRREASHREIRIRTLRHGPTGLLVAVSDDMKGLYVHGNSEEELIERLPVAIRALLEADGYEVERITEIDPPVRAAAGFEPLDKIFDAQLRLTPEPASAG
jgi:hypothetical protein